MINLISCTAKNSSAFCLVYNPIVFNEKETDNLSLINIDKLTENELNYREICS
jgi:hypothetical protein